MEEVIRKHTLTTKVDKINALRDQVSPQSCIERGLLKGDCFKALKSYEVMKEICVTAFAHSHKHGPLHDSSTWRNVFLRCSREVLFMLL